MSTACGRPQGGSSPCGRMWTGEGVKNPIFFARHKWMTPYASQFGAPFPQSLTKSHLKPNFAPFCGPFDPQNISKYIPVSSFFAPFFTCTRGRPPSPAPPHYATDLNCQFSFKCRFS